MSLNSKHTVIIVSLFFVVLPFILVTDLFPFLRFGMFAEPVKDLKQTETFAVSYLNDQGKKVWLKDKEIGLPSYILEQLGRNYFYRNQSEDFLKKVSSIARLKARAWQLNKIALTPTGADTCLIKIYEAR